MGANLQFNSYFPGYYNMDVNGNSWPLNRDNNVNLYNTTFLSTDYLLSYNKELLKQTMLKHETIFKDQIQELHRLYKRQKELMDEIRRSEFKSYLKKSETSNSNMAFFQVATEYVQKNFQVPTTMMNTSSCQIPVSGPEKIPFSKVGKKILDLQLPADEYIDCDEDEKVAPRPVVLSYSVNSGSQVLYTNNAKSVFTENYLNHSTDQSTKSNVQYLLEESVKNAQKKQYLEASTSFLSYPDKTGIYGSKLNSFVQGFHTEKLPSVSKSLHQDLEQAFIRLPIYSSKSSRMKSDPLNNGNNVAVQQDVSSHPSVFDNRCPWNPIAVQALPCFKRHKSSVETPEFGGLKDHKASVKPKRGVEKTHDHSTSELSWFRAKPTQIEPKRAEETCSPSQTCPSKGKSTVLDLNMACDSVPESEPVQTSNELFVIENKKDKGFVCVIDLNSSSVDEVDFHQKPSLDLDAPSSPENKECSPPRGESEGNQAETVMASSDARIAAEAILSFAKEESSEECLEWFAGIVSWVASNNDRAAELELMDEEIDFYEAMTLNLKETKTEQCPPKEEETMTSSLPGQQKKGGGRARRGRGQKDFQREILPSLASLSRHEVTEDLQIIGGLMEAAGSTRNWRARRRVVVGCSAESLLKKLSSGDEGKMGSVVCWGKVTRRRRGQRCPVRVCNQQQLILTQV